MFDLKIRLAAASLVVFAAAGLSCASAAPWEVRHDRQELRHDRQELRHDRQETRQMRRHHRYVSRHRIMDTLRYRHYRVVGDPYWVRGRYMVRVHNRFGRAIFVQVDPYSGAFIREVIR